MDTFWDDRADVRKFDHRSLVPQLVWKFGKSFRSPVSGRMSLFFYALYVDAVMLWMF